VSRESHEHSTGAKEIGSASLWVSPDGAGNEALALHLTAAPLTITDWGDSVLLTLVFSNATDRAVSFVGSPMILRESYTFYVSATPDLPAKHVSEVWSQANRWMPMFLASPRRQVDVIGLKPGQMWSFTSHMFSRNTFSAYGLATQEMADRIGGNGWLYVRGLYHSKYLKYAGLGPEEEEGVFSGYLMSSPVRIRVTL